MQLKVPFTLYMCIYFVDQSKVYINQVKVLQEA